MTFKFHISPKFQIFKSYNPCTYKLHDLSQPMCIILHVNGILELTYLSVRNWLKQSLNNTPLYTSTTSVQITTIISFQFLLSYNLVSRPIHFLAQTHV